MKFKEFYNLLSEADLLGRAFRLTKKYKERGRKENASAKDAYYYIKNAQQKAIQKLEKDGEVTIFHMINAYRLPDSNYNNIGDSLIKTIKYLTSKADQEISVSIESPVWTMNDSIILVGTVNDILEFYDVDTYTTDSKDRFPMEVTRKKGDLRWDEAIVNLKDVKWEAYYADWNNLPFGGNTITQFQNVMSDYGDSINERIRDLDDLEEFQSYYSTEEQTNYIDLLEKIKDTAGELSEKQNRLFNFELYHLDNLSKKYPIFDENRDTISNGIYDEYTRTEIESMAETAEPKNEMGETLTQSDLESLQKDLEQTVTIQQLIWDLSGEIEEEMTVEEKRLINRVCENGRF
jgi:hypothetical protein